MNPTPITMAGESTFNTFSYLLNGAYSLAKSAREDPEGSNYRRISAVLFSAFAIEAHLNHIGEVKLPFWSVVEPKLPWRVKLELIAQQLGVALDYGRRPFQSLSDLFKFRDKLAHGKTETAESSYEYQRYPGDDFGNLEPEWLKKFWSDDAVHRIREDTLEIIKLLHAKAGLDEYTLHTIGSGAFAERKEDTA